MKKELKKYHKMLFPEDNIDVAELPIATDPERAAWAFQGIRWNITAAKKEEYEEENAKRRAAGVFTYHYSDTYFSHRGSKLFVVAVAKLMVDGLVPTPRNVHDLLGHQFMTYRGVANRLGRLTPAVVDRFRWFVGYEPDHIPLRRTRYKRTYAYYVVEPPETRAIYVDLPDE